MSLAAASATATLTADEIIVETALGGVRYCLPSFSKTINLATTGAGGMDTGSSPVSGYVALYAIYNPTTGASALLAKNATSAVQPNVYGGANMPAGYTASALVSVWPTNASGQLIAAVQIDRTISFSPVTILATSTQQASYTAVSAASAIPANARTCRVTQVLTAGSAGAQVNGLVAANTGGAGEAATISISPAASAGLQVACPPVPIVTSQTLYYIATVSSGTFTYTIRVAEYTF
ncbi:phage tail protein [Cupriavidus metallidurans]|nr:phage tail protein [Cupriavidus metallidurans]